MFTVDNKFELNQQVFIIRKEHKTVEKKETCDICLGDGKIMYKGYTLSCPKCHGMKGIVLESDQIDVFSVDSNPHTITSFRYSVTRQGNILKYRIDGNTFDGKNIPEEMVFATKEEAEYRCKELNGEIIKTPPAMLIKDFADKIKVSPAEIIKWLFLRGKIAKNYYSEIWFEDMKELADEHGFICEKEGMS